MLKVYLKLSLPVLITAAFCSSYALTYTTLLGTLQGIDNGITLLLKAIPHSWIISSVELNFTTKYLVKLTEGAEQAYFIPDHTPYCKDGDYEKHQAFTCP